MVEMDFAAVCFDRQGEAGDPVEFDVVSRDGEKWVLASQVGEALGIANIRSLFSDLTKAEGLIEGRHYCRITLQNSGKVVHPGNPNRLLLSYRGVIRVAMRSDGPRAVQFRDWAEDVLYEALQGGPACCGVSPRVGGIDGAYKAGAAIVRAMMSAGKEDRKSVV